MGKMITRSRHIQFLVEGQSEVKILKAFNINKRIKVFNISQCSLEKILRTFMKGPTDFFIIFDIDSMQSKVEEQKRMSTNLDLLLSYKENKIFLLQQTKNLEDEIVRSSSEIKHKKDLFNVFQATGINEFKALFCKSTDPIKKLEKYGFVKNKFWNQKLLNSLEKYVDHQIDFDKMITRINIKC